MSDGTRRVTSDRDALRRLLDELEQPPLARDPRFPGTHDYMRRRREELVARVNARAALLIAELVQVNLHDDLAKMQDALDHIESTLRRLEL